MNKFDKEKLASTCALGTETLLEAAGTILNNPCVQLTALLPPIIETVLVEKEIIKTDISEKLQKQLIEAIDRTIQNCEKKFKTQYIGKKFVLLISYVAEFNFENVSYDNIKRWINAILSKELKEHDMYITQEELNCIWNVFLKEFEYVILDYPELTGYVLFSANRQIIESVKQQNNDNKSSEIPRILTEKAPLPPEEYYGRQQELDGILNKMETETKFVLVNGMGGVGKSTIARKLYHHFLNKSNRMLIWIAYNGHSLRDDFVKQMLYPANHNEDEVILFLLNKLPQNAIVFIDNFNVTEIEDEFILHIANLDCYVICTSRVKELSYFKSIKIDFFNEEECIQLFASYYKREFDQELVKEIVSRAKYHTLVIEVIAKIGMSENLSLAQIIEELKNKGFNMSGVAEINLDEKTLVGHLCKLFSTRKLTSQQKYILVNMSVLDLYYIPCEFINWINLPNKSLLNYLEKHAWINNTDMGYYMHPLIVEVVKRLCDTDYSMVKKMVCGMADFFEFHPDKCASDLIPLLPYAQNIIRRYGKIYTKEMVTLQYDISIIQWQSGDYKSAEKNVKQTIRNAKKNNEFSQDELAEFINHHGVICHSLQKYHRAIRIYENALELRRNSSNKRDIAQTLSNIALEYQILFESEGKQEWINKSLEYQMLSNRLFEEIFRNIHFKHANMASAYNNTGRMYYIQNNYSEAINYFEKARTIREEILPQMHEDMEVTYFFLGCAYEKYAGTQLDYEKEKGFIIQAIKFYKDSLKIRNYNFEKGLKRYDPKEVKNKLEKISEKYGDLFRNI